MPGVVNDLFGLSVPHGKLPECIAALEEGLIAVRKTSYHAILGRGFMHQAEEVAAFIVDFYRSSRKQGEVNALYFEMNGFTINPDCWYFNGFAYANGGDVWDLTWGLEWLTPWQYETDRLTLTGLEDVQTAFEELFCDDKQPLSVKLAGEITEHLIVARFDELIGAANAIAKNACPELNSVPILSTAHEWDILYPSP